MSLIEVYADNRIGFKERLGISSNITLSSMGVAVPTILYGGTHVSAKGVGGPLHVILDDFVMSQTPAPIIRPLTHAAEIRNLNTVVACLVKMMGGAATIHAFEYNQADLLHMSQWYDDQRRLTIKVEDK